MNKQLELVKEFHQKFQVPILNKPAVIPLDRLTLRYNLMHEEVQEYLEGAKNGDVENIAKELADILYTAYGTILEHGLQDVFDTAFEEVHRSQMSKDYNEYKMVKGPDYSEANLADIM